MRHAAGGSRPSSTWAVTCAKPASVTLYGIYTDKLVKTDAGWRLADRTRSIDMPAPSSQ